MKVILDTNILISRRPRFPAPPDLRSVARWNLCAGHMRRAARWIPPGDPLRQGVSVYRTCRCRHPPQRAAQSRATHRQAAEGEAISRRSLGQGARAIATQRGWSAAESGDAAAAGVSARSAQRRFRKICNDVHQWRDFVACDGVDVAVVIAKRDRIGIQALQRVDRYR